MDVEIQWENPAHFLLDRNKNKGGITVGLFAVAADKRAVWFDGESQTPVPIKATAQSPLGFEVLTVETVPALVVLTFAVGYKDTNFSERLLFAVQLFVVGDGKWTALEWLPLLPEEAVALSVKLPKSFNFTRPSSHPLVVSVVNQPGRVTIKIATSFLDVTELWWKAIQANSSDDSSIFGNPIDKLYMPNIYNRWYKDHIDDTGTRIAVLASTASNPPLLWFVIIPQKCWLNLENERIFSQVYYRPIGWKAEGRWSNNINDIIGKNRVDNILATLLWCIMSPVKVLEEDGYGDRKLVAFISDRYKMVPISIDKSTKQAKWDLRVQVSRGGLWSPQAMAVSTSGAGKPQIVFFPIRHENLPGSPDTVAAALEPNLHLRLRAAANVLWCMNYISSTTVSLNYEDDFVVAGYSLGGFNLWTAALNNIDKVKAVIAIEPGGIPFDVSKMKTILASLIRLKRKVFFVGRYKTYGDMGALWGGDTNPGITYLPASDAYDAFFAHKPLTTTNEWLRYVFTGLKKRDDEKLEKNADNNEPHPEPNISREERKAINKLGLTTEDAFKGKFPPGAWLGIEVVHLFTMCGGRVFTPPTLDDKGIVTKDAIYKTFYQECMEAL